MTGTDPCSEEELQALTDTLAVDEYEGRALLEMLFDRHPGDARLHFVRGSLHAGRGDYALARSEIATAIELAPDFAIARFQLGLLHLTSGDAHAAEAVWQPLLSLASDNPLRSFAEGLYALIRDDFAVALAMLERGIAANHDNAPLNHDMKLLIDEIRGRNLEATDEAKASSATHMLLQQATIRPTRH